MDIRLTEQELQSGDINVLLHKTFYGSKDIIDHFSWIWGSPYYIDLYKSETNFGSYIIFIDNSSFKLEFSYTEIGDLFLENIKDN